MSPFAEYDDVQGLIRFGHGRLTEASYLLLRIADAQAARRWIAELAVTPAATTDPPPNEAVQIAFTADGLRALGVASDVIADFAPEFVEGMAESNRARRLGDVGANAPQRWDWGVGSRTPHVVLMLFAVPGGLAPLSARITAAPFGAAFTVLDTLGTADLDGVEPFGFVDGISQPVLDWDGAHGAPPNETKYGEVVALGEFVLGHMNEYGKYTLRPLVAADVPGAALLPVAADDPSKRDVARNGTYLVFRQLEQDVRQFWSTVHRCTQGRDQATRLAESMVGRRLNGDPLIDPNAVDQNAFTFDGDPEGMRCPIGAHIRRANPRTSDYPPGTGGAVSRLVRTLGFNTGGPRADLLASSRFHRVLRRGREYGSGLSIDQALAPPPANEGSRGLHFICLNANIARQFEFVQGAWLMNTTFGGTHGESDPLLGTRTPSPGGEPTDGFSTPDRNGLGLRVSGVPQLVTVKGGAYLFMPGIRALKFLAGASGRSARS